MHQTIHKNSPLILASGSVIRRHLLEQAGLSVESVPARIDEEAIIGALVQEGANPRDIADALAEMKARKVAEKAPDATVIGCDQVLALKDRVFSKARHRTEARDQLLQLRGQTHHLFSAIVLYEEAKPIWRHVGVARLTMREFSDDYLDDYLSRNWPGVGDSVGGYKIEEEGVRLFSSIEGDLFTIQGLPLLPLLSYLTLRGKLPA